MCEIRSLDYVTTDVFTTSAFAGNQLAIISAPSSIDLCQTQKQAIALEFNYSETVFLHESAESQGDQEWKINIFTLDQELPFAGHPTIGTALYLYRRYLRPHGACEGAMVAKAGLIRFRVDEETQVASLAVPHDVHVHETMLSAQGGLRRLTHGIKAAWPQVRGEIEDVAVVSPVEGMVFVLARLSSEHDLDAVSTAASPPQVELDGNGWSPAFTGFYFYCVVGREGGSVDAKTRMIAGLLEDAATGSAAVTLGAYLAMTIGTTQLSIIQGEKMGRPSQIGVRVAMDQTAERDKASVVTIELQGAAVEIMNGKLRY